LLLLTQATLLKILPSINGKSSGSKLARTF
jgi:hypothetical protein